MVPAYNYVHAIIDEMSFVMLVFGVVFVSNACVHDDTLTSVKFYMPISGSLHILSSNI